jgi:hypothetical protein
VLLGLVGSVILLDNCVELYNLLFYGQNWTNAGLQSIVCIRKNINLCSMVWVMVGVLQLLVGSVISLIHVWWNYKI